MTAWADFATAFSSFVLKAKMKPLAKGSGGMEVDLHMLCSKQLMQPPLPTFIHQLFLHQLHQLLLHQLLPLLLHHWYHSYYYYASFSGYYYTANYDSTQSLGQQPYNIHSPIEGSRDLFLAILPEWKILLVGSLVVRIRVLTIFYLCNITFLFILCLLHSSFSGFFCCCDLYPYMD